MRRLQRALRAVGVGYAALASGACAPGYQANDLQLVTAFRAKEVCSCVFVMRHDEEFCRRYTAESPDVASFRVDHSERVVYASAFVLWGATARYSGPDVGCALD